MRGLLPMPAVADFGDFARSWDRLGDDRFMADGGRYRRRRHATFAVGPDGIARKAHQPHYQSRDYNMLNGGIERWFEPIEPGVATGSTLSGVIDFANRVFSSLTPGNALSWHVEVHQFRIEAAADAAGLPTPEGLHRDGVDWVLVMLVARHNVEEGVTKIHGRDREEIGAFCLAAPFDAVLVDDHRIYHAVTPIVPLDPGEPAYRDVLVVTFKAA
ncbi:MULTISPECIES: 2OG-Fe dioxygenase family protein [unclassified Sphingomonas]|nr:MULTISPECIES: 2OG-Fe dioxygenase family protein [unclassified Sphingomonas]